MTNITRTHKRLSVTRKQAAAIEIYRVACEGNDFSRLLSAIVALSDVGLCEADATHAIAAGYVINDGDTGNLCANCKWEVAAVYDDYDKIHRCSDCGAEIIGHEGEEAE